MEPDRLDDEVLSRVGINRRELVRRLVAGTAFAVPVVASFDMAGLTTSSADALTPNQVGGGSSNQTFSPPTITSGSSHTFTAGHPGDFQITASGGPAPSIAVSGALPAGLNLEDSGLGSAHLAGTPAAGTGGVYELEIIAANGMSPNATQTFTLTVDEAPAIVTPGHAAFTIGHPGSAFVVATGFPVPTIAKAGSLPAGLHFSSDPTDGTAIISGSPPASARGSHKVTITATNGISPAAVQTLTLAISREATKPNNHFTVTGVHVARDGTVSFLLTVPDPGTLSATVTAHGHGAFGHKHLVISHAEASHVHVSPSAAGRRFSRPLTLALAVTFKPSGGRSRTVHVRGLRLL